MGKVTRTEELIRRGRGNIDKVRISTTWDEAYRWRCDHCRAQAVLTNIHDAVLLDKLHPCPEMVARIGEAVEYREWVLDELDALREQESDDQPSSHFRDALNDACKECGKSKAEADEVVPLVNGGLLGAPPTSDGTWLCRECADDLEGD